MKRLALLAGLAVLALTLTNCGQKAEEETGTPETTTTTTTTTTETTTDTTSMTPDTSAMAPDTTH